MRLDSWDKQIIGQGSWSCSQTIIAGIKYRGLIQTKNPNVKQSIWCNLDHTHPTAEGTGTGDDEEGGELEGFRL